MRVKEFIKANENKKTRFKDIQKKDYVVVGSYEEWAVGKVEAKWGDGLGLTGFNYSLNQDYFSIGDYYSFYKITVEQFRDLLRCEFNRLLTLIEEEYEE